MTIRSVILISALACLSFKPSMAEEGDGRFLYETYCQACHGETGRGDGPLAEGLETPPANLIEALDDPERGEDYLIWTIEEGGEELHTAMPAFEEKLSELEAREIIAYLKLRRRQK